MQCSPPLASCGSLGFHVLCGPSRRKELKWNLGESWGVHLQPSALCWLRILGPLRYPMMWTCPKGCKVPWERGPNHYVLLPTLWPNWDRLWRHGKVHLWPEDLYAPGSFFCEDLGHWGPKTVTVDQLRARQWEAGARAGLRRYSKCTVFQ